MRVCDKCGIELRRRVLSLDAVEFLCKNKNCVDCDKVKETIDLLNKMPPHDVENGVLIFKSSSFFGKSSIGKIKESTAKTRNGIVNKKFLGLDVGVHNIGLRKENGKTQFLKVEIFINSHFQYMYKIICLI